MGEKKESSSFNDTYFLYVFILGNDSVFIGKHGNLNQTIVCLGIKWVNSRTQWWEEGMCKPYSKFDGAYNPNCELCLTLLPQSPKVSFKTMEPFTLKGSAHM